MKKTFRIENIHCADCARALEEVISGQDGVIFAKINFVCERFEIEIKDDKFFDTFKKVEKIIVDGIINKITSRRQLNDLL